MEVSNCKFEGNHAHIGSAVDITPNVFQRFSGGLFVTPVFHSCNFSQNMVTRNINRTQMQATYGIGTIYISMYNIALEGNNIFCSNLGTAIHVVNGNIDMSQSDAVFKNNSGIQGGAIALIGVSSMIVGPNRRYIFVNNTALGGAIFVKSIDNHDFTTSKTCFIRYLENIPAKESLWDCNISLIGNTAGSGLGITGNTIFTTSLHSCQFIKNRTLYYGSKFEFIGANETFSARGITIEHDVRISNQVATEGAVPQFGNDEVRVFPGEDFEHGVSYDDDLGNRVKELALIAAIQTHKSGIQPDTNISSYFGKHIILMGKEWPHSISKLDSRPDGSTWTILWTI